MTLVGTDGGERQIQDLALMGEELERKKDGLRYRNLVRRASGGWCAAEAD
jgi:hypothetical protein